DDIQNAKASGKAFFGKNVIDICKKSDIAFLGLHGEDGENGKVQAAFDLLGIKYTGSGYLGSALAMDKALTKVMLNAGGVPMAKGFTMTKEDIDKSLNNKNVNIPCVVKPCCGGSSVGVSIVMEESDYEKALDEAFSYENEIMIEEYIKGREFSVGVVGGKALPVIEIIPKAGFYDYKNKYTQGATLEVCPAQLEADKTKEMQKFAEKAATILKLEVYARIDFLMSDKGYIYCLEANALPGMTATSLIPQEAAAIGIDFETLCDKIIALSMEKYN
ncbi:MAG: D-alanine--D-alanine ligase, partial [Eubacterium sp.]